MKKLFLLILALSLVLCLCAAEAEDSLLKSVCDSIDAMDSVHIIYKVRFNNMDTLSEAHAKNGSYYRLNTMEAYGITIQSGTLFVDGTAYSISPELNTATKATSTSSDIIRSNVLLLDGIYDPIFHCADRTDYAVENRELDGISYTVQVYPGSGYTAETAFYFDENGSLVHILKASPEAYPEMSDFFYTVVLIDDQADEGLFDVSRYKIVEP